MLEERRPLAQGASLLEELRAGARVPLLETALAHLLATTERGWVPLAPSELGARQEALALQP